MIELKDIVEIQITKEMIERKNELLKTETVVNNKSVLKGKGNDSGKLAEVIFESLFKDAKKSQGKDIYNFDYWYKYDRYDIKSKTCYVKPSLDYEVSILDYQLRSQLTDYYIFVRVDNKYNRAWVLGHISKVDFVEKSKLYKAGHIDPKNNYTFFKDTYNLKIGDLNPITDIL